MHHLLYSSQDSFISNKTLEKDKNFGLDEMLIVGVSHSYARVLNTTKTYHYGNEYVAGMSFENLTAIFTGSFYGTVSNSTGTIIGNSTKFTGSYFSGSLSGSVVGVETGSAITSTNFSGSLLGYSGSIASYTINGNVSGSLITNCFSTFTGRLTSSVGNATGYVFGDEIKAEIYYTTYDRAYINRSLVKFDLTTISQSIVNGDIISPKFYLKLKSTEARELPVTYKIYVFPISQSWTQGDGYWSDEGSDQGVSWNWRDYNSGSAWYSPYTDTIITSSVDYLNDYTRVTESFSRGGGTWYNIPCTQSFNYQVSDINMDVTTIVNSWLSSVTPNNGFILMYGGETSITTSNANMMFFSNESNTIYSPKLDVAWDDSSWVTGSFGTGSVVITSYNPRVSGSIISPVYVTGSIASGSISGNTYLVVNGTTINTGSIINVTGLTETIRGLSINGSILGTSSLETNSTRYITASLTNGYFTGCEIYAQYSASMLTGFLSGSFHENLFLNSKISGSIPNNTTQLSTGFQYSPSSGSLIGNFTTGSFHNGLFQGVATDGLLKGATVYIPFTGSYCYVSASYSFTSSVEVTGSSLSQLNTSKPFVTVIQNLNKEYSFGDIPKIGVFSREQFPLKTFERSPQQVGYIIPKILPTSSYYSIKDNETEEIIIDFDDYTKLSCEYPGGHYFFLDTTGLAQERYYRILFKVVDGYGGIYTISSNDIFKVRR